MDLFLLLLIIIIPSLAQYKVSSSYSRFKKEKCESELTGQEVARRILDKNGLDDIYIVETKGSLTDHYDPTRRVIKLSHDIFHGTSIASTSIAAHECGHAIQDKEGYFFMKVRSAIFPVVRICTTFSYILILIGIISQVLKIFYVGIAFVGAGLIFQLITLPVEFDASKRAEKELNDLALLSELECDDSKEMLKSAAMTYVAGVLSSALEIVRLLLAFSDNR